MTERDVPDTGTDTVADAGPDNADGSPGDDTSGRGAARSRRGGSRTGLIVSAVVAVVLIAFVVVLATREPASERRSGSEMIGKTAPALAGETLDGGRFDIDDHTGEWVVVNFFATWCLPCREEHPELVRFSEAHEVSGDATVVSVVYDPDDGDETRAYFEAEGGDWPVVVDGRDAVLDYGVAKVPETYLVAPGGTVVQKYTGGVTQQMIEDDMQAVIDAAGGAS